MKTDSRPYPEWETDDLIKAYEYYAKQYGVYGSTGPTHVETFEYADDCLARAQDIRQELDDRGVATVGYLFPTVGWRA